jgi:signal transduction histidine kinase
VRSLRNRLALIFGAIVLGAIAIMYFTIIPRLEDRLEEQKLERLVRDAERYSRSLPRVLGSSTLQSAVEERVRRAAALSSAEVHVLGVGQGTTGQIFNFADSTTSGGVDLDDVQGVVARAIMTGRTVSATEPTAVGRMALAATPLRTGDRVGYVAVFSDSLTDVADNVGLIRRQILVSGGIAFALAVMAGYLVAGALAARVKRLERAARKVASGDFSNRIAVDSEDELGQLAAAFDDMQRQLARLDTARKQFIASASHELRTPIFSLGGYLELLEDEDLDEPTREDFIRQLRGQVNRLKKLATDLLDLSRLESGALELRPEPTDVGQLAREVAGEFTPALSHSGGRIDLRLADGPLEIECDPERVAQVLRILLDNAVVHTPAGTGIVLSSAAADGHIRLEVADRGLGIKRQTMPHIFEPFFTSSDTAQRAGLGLAIARELAERMEGELLVRSVPGSTTFSLVLPR